MQWYYQIPVGKFVLKEPKPRLQRISVKDNRQANHSSLSSPIAFNVGENPKDHILLKGSY